MTESSKATESAVLRLGLELGICFSTTLSAEEVKALYERGME